MLVLKFRNLTGGNYEEKIRCLISALLACMLCSLSVMAAPGEGYQVAADDVAYNLDDVDTLNGYRLIPIDPDAQGTLEATDDIMPRNQIGEPQDNMYFYFFWLYPLVEKPSTGERFVLQPPIGKELETNIYISVSYTKEQTAAIYQDVIAFNSQYGYDFIGWQVKVKFRFNFITPLEWTYSLDNGTPVTETVPQPHNAYQTYVYTYNSYFQSNPMEKYMVSFSGSVKYFDKYDKKYKDAIFDATAFFNVD